MNAQNELETQGNTLSLSHTQTHTHTHRSEPSKVEKAFL